jgi:hypothetical protein
MREKTMFTKSKLTLVAAAIATTIAAPAFAQSTDHTGTLFPSYYNSDGKQAFGSWQAPGRPVVRPQVRGIYNSTVPPTANSWGTQR